MSDGIDERYNEFHACVMKAYNEGGEVDVDARAKAHALMSKMSGEERIRSWCKITADGLKNIAFAKFCHSFLSKLVLDVFGVPPGEAGIDAKPMLPRLSP